MEIQSIQTRIQIIRGHKVMLDFNLAELYGTETRILKQAFRRNIERFPLDFMFKLTNSEIDQLVSQNVIPSKSYFGGSLPFAFTEQGVAMLASVLNSQKAIQVNISIVRAFVLLRQHLANYKDLKTRIQALENEMKIKFKDIHQALNYLLKRDKQEIDQKQRGRIGFKV